MPVKPMTSVPVDVISDISNAKKDWIEGKNDVPALSKVAGAVNCGADSKSPSRMARAINDTNGGRREGNDFIHKVARDEKGYDGMTTPQFSRAVAS